mmetsp:Transcript_38764/g.122174  ORF Transcript_38764/g.122174 Transcript_38764/m.122174 type:complete len:378 (+) Transcript_38764:872-2005(+)
MQQRWRLWQTSGKDRLLWLVEGLDLQPRVLLDPSRQLKPLYPVRVERAQLLWVHSEPLRRLLKRLVLLHEVPRRIAPRASALVRRRLRVLDGLNERGALAARSHSGALFQHQRPRRAQRVAFHALHLPHPGGTRTPGPPTQTARHHVRGLRIRRVILRKRPVAILFRLVRRLAEEKPRALQQLRGDLQPLDLRVQPQQLARIHAEPASAILEAHVRRHGVPLVSHGGGTCSRRLHVDRCRNQQPRVAFELVLAAEPRQFGAVQENEIEKWHAEPNGDLRDRLVRTVGAIRRVRRRHPRSLGRRLLCLSLLRARLTLWLPLLLLRLHLRRALFLAARHRHGAHANEAHSLVKGYRVVGRLRDEVLVRRLARALEHVND